MSSPTNCMTTAPASSPKDNTSAEVRSNFIRYNVVDGRMQMPVPRYGRGRDMVVITNQVRGAGVMVSRSPVVAGSWAAGGRHRFAGRLLQAA